jgi:hypothetical protein
MPHGSSPDDVHGFARPVVKYLPATQPLRHPRTLILQMKNSDMKKRVEVLIFTGIALVGLFACSKDQSKSSADTGGANSHVLTLSQSSVKKGQPLVATLPEGVSASDIKWAVSPSALFHVSSGNGQAMIQFASPGDYRITASYSGADSLHRDSSTAPIAVSDEVYTPTVLPTFDTVSMTGEQVTLTPMLDSNRKLVLLAQSGKSYSCFPYFIYQMMGGGNGTREVSAEFFEIIYGGDGNCKGGKNPASTYLFMDVVMKDYSNGTYPFSVKMNGITYKGTLTITDTDYSFDWNYNAGVIISPQKINR